MGNPKSGRYLSKVLPAGVTLLPEIAEHTGAATESGSRLFGTGIYAGSDGRIIRGLRCTDRSTARCARCLASQYRYHGWSVAVRSEDLSDFEFVCVESDGGEKVYRSISGMEGPIGDGIVL